MGFGQFCIAGNCIIVITTINDVAFHDLGVGGICCCLLPFVLSFWNRVVNVRDELWVVFEASGVQYGEVGINPLVAFRQVGLSGDHKDSHFGMHQFDGLAPVRGCKHCVEFLEFDFDYWVIDFDA